MIQIKTPEEIDIMAQGGEILNLVMEKVMAKVKVGVTTLELDKYAEELILAAGGKPSFKMEKGYFHATCICVNDIVVHGIPDNSKLLKDDVLGIDCGVFYKGFHTDASWTMIVGSEQGKVNSYDEKRKFLQVGELALDQAIKQCQFGKHIGDISRAIQETVEGGGYSCVKQLVGHGVGKLLHEDPEIPCYIRGKVENTPEIKVGMVLAVEVIYNQGTAPIVYRDNDGWTIVTRDGKLSGLFEHTVAITKSGLKVLTKA